MEVPCFSYEYHLVIGESVRWDGIIVAFGHSRVTQHSSQAKQQHFIFRTCQDNDLDILQNAASTWIFLCSGTTKTEVLPKKTIPIHHHGASSKYTELMGKLTNWLTVNSCCLTASVHSVHP